MKKNNKKQSTMVSVATTATAVPEIRKFYVQRTEDVSGLSGTGIVAVGVMFPSGLCVMEWTTPVKSVGHYHSIADLEKIHGHEGKTQVIWA